MYIKWSRQAHGFNQATYPNKNYNLSATLVREDADGGDGGNGGDGGDVDQSTSIPLGSVTVEENAKGGLTFLFGSQRAFWPIVRKKLQSMEMSPEERKNITDTLAKKIPEV